MKRVLRGGCLIGGICFAVGYVGPLYWWPESNLGPLLGIFVTAGRRGSCWGVWPGRLGCSGGIEGFGPRLKNAHHPLRFVILNLVQDPFCRLGLRMWGEMDPETSSG